MGASDMYLFFFVLHVPFFYKHSTNNAQTSNKYVGRKGMRLNCHAQLWAEMAMDRMVTGCFGPIPVQTPGRFGPIPFGQVVSVWVVSARFQG